MHIFFEYLVHYYRSEMVKFETRPTNWHAGTISPMDFLNQILHNDKTLRQHLSDFTNVDNEAEAEIDKFNFEVENEAETLSLRF